MILHNNKISIQEPGFKTEVPKALTSFLILVCMVINCYTASAQQEKQMVRIAEIEIDSAYLEEYKAILEEEASASVKLEPGVIVIFPMFQKENPTRVRILEIYANRAAYEQHLKTPHFQKYKTTTLKMVKSLNLADMEVIDGATMSLMFKKLKK